MPIDPSLLEVLACPDDRGPLLYFVADGALYNPRNRRKYRVEDEVPVLVVAESQVLDEVEHQALLAKAETLGVRPNW